MRPTLTILLLYPLLLAAQSFGSFEVYGAAGFSATSSTFNYATADFRPAVVGRAGFAVGQRLLLRTGLQISQ